MQQRCTTSPGLTIFIQAAPAFSWILSSVSIHALDLSIDLEPGITAGQDATEAFFSLHRHEVLLKPQYARLQIGSIKGSKPLMKARAPGELSDVPYAEPSWLSDGFYSPYFKEVCFICVCRT